MQNHSASRFCPGGFSAGAKAAEVLIGDDGVGSRE
jgi:hypothetical protein